MEFQDTIQDILMDIDPTLTQDTPETELAGLYGYVKDYACEKKLTNTALALPLIHRAVTGAATHPGSRFRNARTHMAYFRHSLSVCHLIIDLRLPLDTDEEDILLASAICHILPENIRIADLHKEITFRYRLDPRVYEIVSLLFREDNMSEAETKEYFDTIPRNKLALLLKLADRGNLAEQLYGISSWTARNYIHETRLYFFPMCIYAKEHYPELLAPVSVMMEKMRSLIEIAEILLGRYEARENELTLEIETLLEDNAMLRGMIRQMEG